MIKLLILLAVLGSSCMVQETSSEPSADITVPKNALVDAEVISMFAVLKDIALEGGGKLPVSDLFKMVRLTAAEKAAIEKNRGGEVEFKCDSKLRCKGSNVGRPFSFSASQVRLPVVGVPKFQVLSKVYMEFRVISDTQSELCRIEGLKVKKSFLSMNVDGALLTIRGDKANVLMDAGMGGSYPSSNCR